MDDSEEYRKLPMSDRSNYSMFLMQLENEEIISEIKQPSLSSINLTDSWYSSISSQQNHCQPSELGSGYRQDNENLTNEMYSNFNSEPEDMQDCLKQVNTSFEMNDSLLECEIRRNKMIKTPVKMGKSEDLIDPYIFTSSPLSVTGKKVSLSLQDMSTIEMFPLIPKTNNAFSTETIQSQSMSSTTKSKDSGFQRSASCLSLNSGNRTYDHVQSKVKQYIKDIKESEALRKKQQNISSATKKSRNSDYSFTASVETLSDNTDLLKTVTILKKELQEKDSVLNHLQENYNSLLEKYAQAVNQIDFFRLSHSYRSEVFDDTGALIDNISDGSNLWRVNEMPPSLNLNVIKDKQESSDFCQLKEELSATNISDFLNSHRRTSSDFNNESENIQPKLNKQLLNVKTDVRNLFNEETKVNFSPQSGSYSIPVNSIVSVKSTTLRPISKICSSSSRLDKKVTPLPSSNLTSSSKKSKQLVRDSHLELPKVDPFDKVKKWQALLPTRDLISSPKSNNSSLDSNDSLERLKINKVTSDNKKISNSTFNSSRPLSNENKCLKRSDKISKSEQNLYSNPRIYSEYYMKSVSVKDSSSYRRGHNKKSKKSDSLFVKRLVKTDAFERNSSREETGKKKSDKHILKRGDAFEMDLSQMNSNSDSEDSFLIHSVSQEQQENSTLCSNNIADESSSISSSVLSSTRENDYITSGKNNHHRSKVVTPRTYKSSATFSPRSEIKYKKSPVNRSKVLSESKWNNLNVSATKSKSPAKGSSQSVNRELDANANRACFSLKNQHFPSKNRFPSREEPKLDVNKMNTRPVTPNSNKKKILYQRSEKLKSYTELLNSGSKTCSREIGVQVEVPETNLAENEGNKVMERFRILTEADEYVKQLKEGMYKLEKCLEHIRMSPKSHKRFSLDKEIVPL